MDASTGQLDQDIQDALRTLTSQPAFKAITVTDMVGIARRGQRRTFAPGTALMEHGRASNCLYLLLKGRASVQRTFGLDRAQPITEIRAGDLVGEMGSFTGVARAATVTAIDQVEALELTERSLHGVLRQDHPFMVALVRLMNERYKQL